MELFNSLRENTKNITTPLDETQKIYVITTIPKLDQKGHDTLFFLIRMFHNQQSKDITFTVPYQKSVNEAGDIEFDLTNFPPSLQHMTYMFTRMHYEYITSETLRK
jgi:hypothetical protein